MFQVNKEKYFVIMLLKGGKLKSSYNQNFVLMYLHILGVNVQGLWNIKARMIFYLKVLNFSLKKCSILIINGTPKNKTETLNRRVYNVCKILVLLSVGCL